MATEGVNGDWLEAEISRQLELISLENDSDGEIGGEESIHQQTIPENTIPQAIDSSTPLHTEIAYSVFQNYLQALSKEHTVVDSTLIQAKDALIHQRQEKQPTPTDFNNTEESRPNQEHVALSFGSLRDSTIQLHAKGNTTESQDKSLVMKTTDDGVDGIREENGYRKFKKDHMFGEEAEEMKSAVEKYKQEQVQLEEQLLQELNQREADLDAMIEESLERRRRQEEVMRERARREEGRRTRAVVLLQAAARGYLTRNKITPKLVALRERKRLEGERERRRAQAAIAIQAVWRGYRSRSRYKQAVEVKREAQHKREKAATVVQTCWRGYRAKQLFHDLKTDKLEQQLQRDAELKRKQAATSLQAWWRGYRARILFRQLKIEKLQQHSTSQQLQQGSEGKLTVAKRIQSSLKLMEQSSLSEQATGAAPMFSSLDSSCSERSRVTSENRETSNTASQQKEAEYAHVHVSTPEGLEGQGSPPSRLPVPSCPVNNVTKLPRNTSTILAQSQEKSPLTSVSVLISPKRQMPESPPQRLAAVSMGKLSGSGSGSVLGKLARSLSECDRKALINELQCNNPLPTLTSSDRANDTKQKREDPGSSVSLTMSTAKQPVRTSTVQNTINSPDHKHLQSDTTTKKVQRQIDAIPSTSLESEGSSVVEEKNAKTVESSEERALAEEQRALALLVERREAEEMVAQLSRERMNSMLSEEEIAEVAKRKRSHSTYRQELEHACTPLLPHAWLGVIEERMEQWRKKHKRWKQPKNVQRQIPNLLQNRPLSSTSPKKQLHSKSCYSHPNPSILSSKTSSTDSLHSVSLSPTNPQSHSTCRSLSDAQLLAASPRGTRLEETACVMLYRSRGDVNIPDIGRRCPRLSTLSLTKCGAMRMVDKESEGLGGVWEELVELNLQSNMMEHVDCREMNELRFVDLSDNRLASIHGLGCCPSVLELCLSDNRIARVGDGLTSCSGLQLLNMDSNLLINCRGLEGLPLLQEFSCAENHLPKVDGLANCSLLQHLKLSQNNLQLQPILCNHVLLRELYLDENSLSDVTPIANSWLPLLQTLSLSNNCIVELSSLTCLVMLNTLDVTNNSIYDLPLLLQGLRGCLQLKTLHLHGNPVAQEPKFRAYVSKALHSLSELDGQPLTQRMKKTPLSESVQSSPIYQLCCRQIEEQDGLKQQQQMEIDELKSDDSQSPSPHNTRRILIAKISHCHSYERLLIQHLREHETIPIARHRSSSSVKHKSISTDRKDQWSKAITLIQSLVRGWLARRRVTQMRQSRAATVIQAHYRGYLLRRRLREILESAHYAVSVGESEAGGEDEGQHQLDLDEQVISLDYLDESLLDADIKPLSPTDEHLMNFTTRQPPHTSSVLEDDASHQNSYPRPVLVPAYSMPGAADDEVTFDIWRNQQQQQQQKDIVPPAQQPYSISSLPHYHHQQLNLRESQSHGESTPSGCSETRNEVHTEKFMSSESPQPRPHVQQAWGSQTQLLTEADCRRTHTPNRVPSSGATQARETQRKEKIISDWGFQSSATAELMMKRMNRQKRLQSNVIKRQKMNDPGHRLTLFHKHQRQVKDDDATNVHPVGIKQRAQQRHLSAHSIPDLQDGSEKSHYQWVHEQHLVHKGEGRDPPKGGSSFLPSMETHVLAGHKPRLMTSAHQNKLVESSPRKPASENKL